MSTLQQIVTAAIQAGDTAEAIARRAGVSGDTVRRMVNGLPVQARTGDLVIAALAGTGGAAPGLAPQLERDIAWGEQTLARFVREYTARVAESLGTSMAAAIRSPAASTLDAATARELAGLKASLEPPARPADAARSRRRG
jgi:hypothetical protein